jgi:hypothetical protein
MDLSGWYSSRSWFGLQGQEAYEGYAAGTLSGTEVFNDSTDFNGTVFGFTGSWVFTGSWSTSAFLVY